MTMINDDDEETSDQRSVLQSKISEVTAIFGLSLDFHHSNMNPRAS